MVFVGFLPRLAWIRQVSLLLRPTTLSTLQARSISNLRYTKTHEWIRPDSGTYTVGLSKFATDTIGDVVFVDLPDPGTKLRKGETFGNAESSKATSELFAPISGTVEEINEAIRDKPSLLNKSPEKDGWLLKVKPDSSDESDDLMTEGEYREFLRSGDC
ncbi:glycine cleavage system H protein [Echinococcus multilocularis]|uniref:Glycine cleavage system H protein n=1 Tax=Echinococcus multilocularis TaxID=6211 RepID=A0A068YB22_ECHMU|nr:glycine cleavage system H protein [Echinococcus multilocularis]